MEWRRSRSLIAEFTVGQRVAIGAIIALVAMGAVAFVRLLWISDDLPFLFPRTQGVFGLVVAAPSILIAALWFPRLAVILAGAILGPIAMLMLALAFGDFTPGLTHLCTGFPWSDIPADQVGPGDIACFGGGFPEPEPSRTAMLYGALSSGLALGFVLLRWPHEAAYGAVAGAVALGVVVLAYVVRYFAVG